ncbi:MAG: LacI family DNA-binding transcriptional regulator [Anaerococcus sp.]|nr:LacI family DNA-binding transcriptional regulator [Anaerococcus sp.]
MANINDIAKKTGFSKSTISRYLNKGSVSKATSDKIKAAIDELGYVPNKFAQSLKSSSSKTIGVVIPNFYGFSKNMALDAINSYLSTTEYTMLLSSSNNNSIREIEILEEMVRLNVDGVILFASKISSEHKKFFKSIDIPLLIYGQEVKGEHCICVDDYASGVLMGDYIKSLNHKEISYLDVGSFDKAVRKRFKGLSDSLENSPIKINHHLVNFKKEKAYDKILEIFDKEQASFYIGATDNIAFGIINALTSMGIKIPENISVAGFGDYDISSMVAPSLTTVRFPYSRSGLVAIEYMLKLISGESIEKETLLKGSLIVRNSSK